MVGHGGDQDDAEGDEHGIEDEEPGEHGAYDAADVLDAPEPARAAPVVHVHLRLEAKGASAYIDAQLLAPLQELLVLVRVVVAVLVDVAHLHQVQFAYR